MACGFTIDQLALLTTRFTKMKKLLGLVFASVWFMGCSDETELSNFAAYSTGMLAAADSVESVYSLGE